MTSVRAAVLAAVSGALVACSGGDTTNVPVARAGEDRTVMPGSQVALDGSASTAPPNGAPISYAWSQKSGTTVTLSSVNAARPTFTAPTAAGSLVFSLTVSSGPLVSAADEVTVIVDPEADNRAPYASAGFDTSVYRRAVVTLSGNGWDPEGKPITYRWTQTGGTTVTLENPILPSTTFVAPDGVEELEFELTVSDGVKSASDRVSIKVTNRSPTAGTASLTPTAPRTLDDLTVSLTSSDPDGDALSYSYVWTRNGSVIAGQGGATLPNSETTRGDQIAVTVTVSDGVATVSRSAAVTILDTPPEVTASPPTSIAHCAGFAFEAVASDADGDPVGPFALLHGPSGMTVSTTGSAVWNGCLPMFDRTIDVAWAIGLVDHPAAKLSGTVRVEDPTRNFVLRRTSLVAGSQVAFETGDFDGDGDVETLTATPAVLSIIARAGTAYEQQWVYPFGVPGRTYRAATAGDVDGDSKLEIFFSTPTHIVRLGGADRRSSAEFDTSSRKPCNDLELADLDGDADLELVCLGGDGYNSGTTDRVLVLDAATFSIAWEAGPLGLGTSLAVGNVDDDAALEVVTNRGYLFDGATGTNEWAYSNGFGNHVATGNFDGVGALEIIGLNGTKVTTFTASGGAKSPLAEYTTASEGRFLHVVDVDGDGKVELLTGDSSGNLLGYRYDSAKGTLPSYLSVSSGVSFADINAAAFGDVDGDGAKEYVFSFSDSFSGSFYAVAGGSPNVVVEWKSPGPTFDSAYAGGSFARLSSSLTGLAFGVATTNNGYDGTRLMHLDPVTGAVKVSKELGSNWNNRIAMAVADYDKDLVDDVLLATSETYDGYYLAHDLSTDISEWTTPADTGIGNAVVAGDANADTYPDFITVSQEGYLEAYDVKNQVLIWKSTTIGTGRDVAYADLDGDAVAELVALTANGLFVYAKTNSTPVSYLQRASITDTGLDLVVDDLDADGVLELYVLGSSSGGTTPIKRFDTALTLVSTFSVSGTAPTSIHAEGIGGTRRNLLLGVGSTYYYDTTPSVLRALDPTTGALVWTSPPLNGLVARNSVTYVDVLPSSGPEISFATSGGMHVTR